MVRMLHLKKGGGFFVKGTNKGKGESVNFWTMHYALFFKWIYQFASTMLMIVTREICLQSKNIVV